MAFGPVIGTVTPLRGFHYTFTSGTFKKNPLGGIFDLTTVHPGFAMSGVSPRKTPLPTFSIAAIVVNWVNPLSAHMFPVKPLPGISGGGGGGGGTVGYGS